MPLTRKEILEWAWKPVEIAYDLSYIDNCSGYIVGADENEGTFIIITGEDELRSFADNSTPGILGHLTLKSITIDNSLYKYFTKEQAEQSILRRLEYFSTHTTLCHISLLSESKPKTIRFNYRETYLILED